MVRRKVFVVTNPENGWDCVQGVYKATSEEALREELDKDADESTEDELIIHEISKIVKI